MRGLLSRIVVTCLACRSAACLLGRGWCFQCIERRPDPSAPTVQFSVGKSFGNRDRRARADLDGCEGERNLSTVPPPAKIDGRSRHEGDRPDLRALFGGQANQTSPDSPRWTESAVECRGAWQIGKQRCGNRLKCQLAIARRQHHRNKAERERDRPDDLTAEALGYKDPSRDTPQQDEQGEIPSVPESDQERPPTHRIDLTTKRVEATHAPGCRVGPVRARKYATERRSEETTKNRAGVSRQRLLFAPRIADRVRSVRRQAPLFIEAPTSDGTRWSSSRNRRESWTASDSGRARAVVDR